MEGIRRSITSGDDVRLGLLSAGSGSPLLLVHGGFGQIESWAPIWDSLIGSWRVTAMDRRGRGSSGDASRYDIAAEYGDVAAVAAFLAAEAGESVDVFAHSYGATVAIGAASRGAPFRRLVAYEPPGPETLTSEWVERTVTLVGRGRAGAAMVSFLTEVLGLNDHEVEALEAAPSSYDILSVLAATLEREAHGLMSVDLASEARSLKVPITLLRGERSPRWAATITDSIAEQAPNAEVVMLAGVGHEAIGMSPEVIVRQLLRTLG